MKAKKESKTETKKARKHPPTVKYETYKRAVTAMENKYNRKAVYCEAIKRELNNARAIAKAECTASTAFGEESDRLTKQLQAERAAARETEEQLRILRKAIQGEALPEIVALNKQLADAETDRDNFKAGFENYRTLYHQAIEKSITRRLINWWTRRKDG